MSTQDYATARQRRYEDVWFTITGDDWPVPLHFLEEFADKIRAEQGETDHPEGLLANRYLRGVQ